MDGNNSLKLVDSTFRSGSVRTDNRLGDSKRWISPEDVDIFKDEVKKKVICQFPCQSYLYLTVRFNSPNVKLRYLLVLRPSLLLLLTTPLPNLSPTPLTTHSLTLIRMWKMLRGSMSPKSMSSLNA